MGAVRGWFPLRLSPCCSHAVLTPKVAERGQQLVVSASWCAQLPMGKWQHLDLFFGKGFWMVKWKEVRDLGEVKHR